MQIPLSATCGQRDLFAFCRRYVLYLEAHNGDACFIKKRDVCKKVTLVLRWCLFRFRSEIIV